MVRKTREQVWRELDDLGEDEVRQRLSASREDPSETRLVREWLRRKERVASELWATAAGAASGYTRSGRLGRLALIAMAAAATTVLVSRRGR